MSDSPFAQPPSWSSADEETGSGRSINLSPPVLIAAAALILVLIFGSLIIRSLLSDRADGTATPDATQRAEYALPAGDLLVVDSGTPQPQVNAPVGLSFKGAAFEVLPYQVPADGAWRYPAGRSGQAVWVYGTIINYVIGLEQTRDNTALLDSLAAGDEITVTTTSGLVYHFGFVDRELLTTAGYEVFAQTRPGLTLLTLGGDQETRQAVYADYVTAEKEGAPRMGGLAASVGEPVQLGEIRVTVLGTAYVYDAPQVPQGWAFYLVDFQVENFSSEILDPNRFRLELQDGTGATYSPNLPASQAGTFGYLLLTIPPNTVAHGTAGYLVPAPLQGPKLSWSFSRLDEPEYVVKVLIDFETPAVVVDPRLLAAVNLSGAELSSDRGLVTIWGTVLNNSEETLTIAMTDVTLSGDGSGPLPLRAADPALPWTLVPGDVVSFRVAFQPPGTPVATFTLVDHPFEISGLE